MQLKMLLIELQLNSLAMC
ncbi:hypothetical protein Gotur_004120, partial [Gossypium turneri]